MTDNYSRMRSLWYRFCGVTDAIKSLHNRYDFLSKEYHPFIPNFSKNNTEIQLNPFKEMNLVIIDLKQYLMSYGFERGKEIPEKSTVNSIEFNLNEWRIFNFKFWELIVLYEIIKSNFYKRSVSLEIPQEELGYHRGLELTTGNEGFTLGGDIITAKILSSVNLFFKWDGLFSFEIPYERIYGGSFKLFRQFNMFHISLSDELKYFAGFYFLIAHEISHALMFNPKSDILSEMETGPKNSYWYFILFRNLKDIISGFKDSKKCKNIDNKYFSSKCPLNKILNLPFSINHLFIDSLADYFATKLSGFYYLITFIDLLPYIDFQNYMRISFVHKLLIEENLLDEEENSIFDRKCEVFSSLFDDEEKTKCRQCIEDLLLNLVKGVSYFNKNFIKEFITTNFLEESQNDLSILINYFPSIDEKLLFDNFEKRAIGNKVFEQMHIEIKIPETLTSANISDVKYKEIFKPLFNYLVIEPYKKITIQEKDYILNLLRNNKPIEGKNPLVLLNIYYEFYEKGNSIDFYTFLYSIFKSKH